MKIKTTWLATEQSVAPTVTSKWARGYGGPSTGAEWANMAIEGEFEFFENHPQDSRVTKQDTCPTVTSRWGTGGGNIPLVLFNHHMQDGRITESNGVAQTISARDGESGSLPLVLMDAYQYHGYRESETTGTLTAGISKGVRGDTPLVLMDQGGGVMTVETDKVGTLRAQTHGHEPLVLHKVYPIDTAPGDKASNLGFGNNGDPMFTLTQTSSQKGVAEIEIYPLKLGNALRTNDKPDGGCGVAMNGEPMFTLTTSCGSCGVAEVEAYRISSDASNVMRSSNPNTGIKKADISPTLDTVDPSPSKGQGGLAIVQAVYENQRSELRLSDRMNSITTPGGKAGQGSPVVLIESQGGAIPHCFKVRSGCDGGGKGYLGSDDKSFTLATTNDQYLMTNDGPYMLQGNMIGRSDNAGPQGKGYREDTAFTLNATDVQGVVAPALTTNDPSRSPRASEVTAQIASVFEVTARVRKLTPTECERLQGFPDGHTKIPYKGKPEELCPDSPRYKALGNSWCVPCVRWIGQRIQDHLDGKL